MAGSFVKNWFKKCTINPRILLGKYKPVLDCPTDTEEIVCATSERAPSPSTTPPGLLICKPDNVDRLNTEILLDIPDNSPTQKSTKLRNEQPVLSEFSKHFENVENHSKNIRLEEFTCDVSIDNGKKTPLQFSFTFYDLDGHNGKMSKDDLVGIVYTIYESIGKSMTIPFIGSKTINVRLTMSSDKRFKKNFPHKVMKQVNKINKKKCAFNASEGLCKKRSHKPKYRRSKFINGDEEPRESNINKENYLPNNIATKESVLGKNVKNCTKNFECTQKQKRILRKSRKQKTLDSRQRNVLIGNNNLSKSRNIFLANRCNERYVEERTDYDTKNYKNQNGFKRNELIDIIRESMEKNKLCFQSNSKSSDRKYKTSSSVSSSCHSEKQNNKKYLQPHIPIYQQQLAINPAIFTGSNIMHGKQNLCGYDSFLHAKICNGENNISMDKPINCQPHFSRNLTNNDPKSRKNVKNSILYTNLNKKYSKTSYDGANDNSSENFSRDYIDKGDKYPVLTAENILELENLIHSEDDDNPDYTKNPEKAESSNGNNSFSSSTIHRYVHEHIHHHYHHFENKK